ncbi:SsrA-binding protein SmpB [Parvularcula sp. ZS-1/3]|uniref:SsrA-binding protein n=1 Tax=Parvularcula mediterranea TaxID=2732508 RepID=A0A7Y3W6I6_9PROT|nr:SsrA-binding protein SmpB [Parvularcula mediterranea]NNU17316.1 SsrA-binding protein SmpB [Parvularcula mediterranea]
MAKKQAPTRKLIADNKKARFEYKLDDTIEAGLVLTGTEVKALREGKANIAESYCSPENGPNGPEIWLINANIPEYSGGNRENHQPKRNRKLLLHKRQMNQLVGAVEKQGRTIIPVRMVFDKAGRVKLDIAIAEGKKLHDKRQTQKDRDWGRQKQRIMKDYG